MGLRLGAEISRSQDAMSCKACEPSGFQPDNDADCSATRIPSEIRADRGDDKEPTIKYPPLGFRHAAWCRARVHRDARLLDIRRPSDPAWKTSRWDDHRFPEYVSFESRYFPHLKSITEDFAILMNYAAQRLESAGKRLLANRL